MERVPTHQTYAGATEISFPKGRHCRFQQYPVANRHGDDPVGEKTRRELFDYVGANFMHTPQQISKTVS